jgi:hypothetical protein
MTHWAAEETDDPTYADARNFFKVEQWTTDDFGFSNRHLSKRAKARASMTPITFFARKLTYPASN